jgi:hypothetical protein
MHKNSVSLRGAISSKQLCLLPYSRDYPGKVLSFPMCYFFYCRSINLLIQIKYDFHRWMLLKNEWQMQSQSNKSFIFQSYTRQMRNHFLMCVISQYYMHENKQKLISSQWNIYNIADYCPPDNNRIYLN